MAEEGQSWTIQMCCDVGWSGIVADNIFRLLQNAGKVKPIEKFATGQHCAGNLRAQVQFIRARCCHHVESIVQKCLGQFAVIGPSLLGMAS